eukprot:scaffold263752_cov24-Prasinocladus_malaysianus.AAC.2
MAVMVTLLNAVSFIYYLILKLHHATLPVNGLDSSASLSICQQHSGKTIQRYWGSTELSTRQPKLPGTNGFLYPGTRTSLCLSSINVSVRQPGAAEAFTNHNRVLSSAVFWLESYIAEYRIRRTRPECI